MTVCERNLTFDDLSRRDPANMEKFYALCKQENVSPITHYEYLQVIQHLLESGINAVVDIGCGSGEMAYMFRAAGIRYVGIEANKDNIRLGELREKDGSVAVLHAKWPCAIPEMDGITTCIAMHSIGTRSVAWRSRKEIEAIKSRFDRMYLISFADTQEVARDVFGTASEWIHPMEEGGQWIQICEHTQTTPRHTPNPIAERLAAFVGRLLPHTQRNVSAAI